MARLSYTEPIPEDQIIASRYVIFIDHTASVLSNPQAIRRYAGKTLKKEIGDEVQLGAIRIKKPNPLNKCACKLLRRSPQARLYVTTVF